MSSTVHEIDVDALDALIGRLNAAKEFNFSLSKEDIDLLLRALATLATLQSSLSSNDITIHKMRKLLGIVACVGAQVNPFEYFTALHRHRDRVKADPGN